MQLRTWGRLTLVILLGVLASARLLAQAERPTLREMAAESGGIMVTIQGCGPSPSLAAVLSGTDLIVEGTVRSAMSYLTVDERDIFTDYDLAIHHVLYQREMQVSSRPGMVAAMIFKSHGGQVTVDGLRLAVDVRSNDARVAMRAGDRVYVFASRDRDAKWLFRPSSVFKVIGTNVTTPDKFSDLPNSLSVSAFVQRIRELQPVAAIPLP